MNFDEKKLQKGTDEKMPDERDRRHTFDPLHRSCLGCLPPRTDPLNGEPEQPGPRLRRVPRYDPETPESSA
jgi:hypothetical protein